MKRALVLFLVTTTVIAISLAYSLSRSETKPAVIAASEVLTWDCEYPETKPESIMITCGDGGMYVDRIEWSSWEATGAHGTGFYNVNDCDPDCADGKMHKARVKVELSGLTIVQGKNFLRTMEIQTLDGKNLPESSQSHYIWDVMEFEEMMNK
ncbi:hypothetical protein MCEMRE182_00500 [Candidatus Nanopelagicaceae bacterium]